jgi:von Willebrand factor type A domain
MAFKQGDVVIVVSTSLTEPAHSLNDQMKRAVGKQFVVEGYNPSNDSVTINGCVWCAGDLKLAGEIDKNLDIPTSNNHRPASKNGHSDVLKERINYIGDYLSGLHNTDVFKRGKHKTMRYDGSGTLTPEGIPAWFVAKNRVELLQRKKVGFLRDRPDVIIMLDNSSSTASAGIVNHLRCLSGAISSVFFAELNKIYLITFGEQGRYYEFDDKNIFVEHLLEKTLFDEGSTRYDLAFTEAIRNNCLSAQTRPRLVILLTDGVPTDLMNNVTGELEEARQRGDYQKDDHKHPAVIVQKSTLLKSIDMISSLSALDNTVFRMYILAQTNDVDAAMERIADEISQRLKGANQFDDDSRIILRRFISEIMSNGTVFSFQDFMTGKLMNDVVTDIKKEFYKLNASR